CSWSRSSLHSHLCLHSARPALLGPCHRSLLHRLLWILHWSHLRAQRLPDRCHLWRHFLHHHLSPRHCDQEVSGRCQQLVDRFGLLQQRSQSGGHNPHHLFERRECHNLGNIGRRGIRGVPQLLVCSLHHRHLWLLDQPGWIHADLKDLAHHPHDLWCCSWS
ncbi:hypothetical protein BGZ52_000512, partial [Haplosporangium bisporale]